MVSCWCTDLRWKDIGSREELSKTLVRAYNRRTTVVQIGVDNPVLDWSTFISPYLAEIGDHSGPHVFGFLRGPGCAAHLRTKNWARDTEWLGDEKGNPLL